MKRLVLPMLLLASVLPAACGPKATARSDAGSDAGHVPDGGPAPDAGHPPDAGQLLDAGPLPDAGLGSHALVVVHYDVGFGHRITVRGSAGPLSWSTGVDATWQAGNWVLDLDLSAGPVELKPLVDDTTWAAGPNWQLAAGQVLDVWPFFFHTGGVVKKWGDWASTALGNTRGVWVYYPPSYDENPAERYPVVYMHDGQNLFDDSTAFGGISWKVQGAMDQGASDASIHEALVVGIENTSARLDEYTPVFDPSENAGGKGDVYLQAIIQDLKPQIDASLRTLPDRSHTAIAGSSLGGLISAYAGDKYPETFGLVGALSPSTWWDGTWIIATTAATAHAPVQPLRVYVDSGDSGTSQDDMVNTAKLAQTYRDLGIPLDYVVQAGASHSEYWWRQRIPGGLGFLLGPR